MGATVIAAASTDEKLEVCRRFGAAETINYTEVDLKAWLKDYTGGKGVDVVYDPVGGELSEPALRALAWNGRLLVIGFAAGEIPRIPLNLVLLKGVVVKGYEIRTFGLHAPELAERDRAEMQEMFRSGRIHPHVSASFPLERTSDALRMVADRRAVGKVLIEP
jgi:NADPH2:quinone reductase